MDIEKTILRKVGEAIGRFRMIREGDRVAVGVSRLGTSQAVALGAYAFALSKLG